MSVASGPHDAGRDGGLLSRERLRRLLTVGRDLVGELDLDAVLLRVLEAARELTGAQFAALGVLDAEGRELERFLTVGIDEEQRGRIGDLPRGHGVLGVLIREPRPLRLSVVGGHPESYGFPVDHPAMESFLGVPVRVGEEVYGNLYLTDKADAEEFDEVDEATVVALAEWAAVGIENARRHGGVRGQRDELVRAVRAFETTESISRALAGETQVERILELVVKRARALVEARGMVVGLRDGEDFVVRAVSGEIDRSTVGRRLPIEGTLEGQVLRSGRASRLAEATGAVSPLLVAQLGARAALAVPLRFRGRSFGVLAAFDRLGAARVFSAEDERLMLAFASVAAPAVAMAEDVAGQVLSRSMQAAEAERSRWARELHDETLQDLAGLKVLLSGARRASDRADVDAALEQAIEHVEVGIAALRGLITDLRPASLDELGTEPALRALVERVASTSGLRIDLDVDLAYETGRTTARHVPELESTMYRLVQEALTNVVKHARTDHVRVAVVEGDDAVEVTVRDDGAGFDREAETEGFGLLGMRERVALVGGTLDIASQRGAGTTLTARLPVRRRAADHRARGKHFSAAQPPTSQAWQH